jgi:peptidyl-prolyl cis-trans isomerase C
MALAWKGCAPAPEAVDEGRALVPEGALAVVGDQAIDERQLRRFEAAIQPVHRSKKEGVEKHRDHLLSLIDVKLMVLEAQARNLDRGPELAEALRWIEHQAMIEAYLQARVGTHIEIGEEELHRKFEAHPARHAVRGAHILVRDRATADSIHARLMAGASFEEMARRHSLDRATAPQGGAFEKYYAFDRVSDQVYAEVFSMEAGQISRPFRTPQGWEIAKVVDKKLVSFEQYRPVVQYAALMEKFNTLKKEHVNFLAEKWNLRVQADRLRMFLEAWNRAPGRPDLSPEHLEAALYTYDGGEVTLQQAVYLLINTGLGQAQADSALVEQRVREKAAPDLLLEAEARQAGFADWPQVREQVAEEREKRLLQELWKEVLEDQLGVGEEEARAHYQAHPELYRAPAEIVVQEILVARREEAEQLLQEIRDGADMGELASRHSLRRYAGENSGLYGMRAFERMIYRELMDAAAQAPVGQIQGPLPISSPLPSTLKNRETLERAYSIFQVLQRLPERVQTFELSKQRALFFARQEKQQARLGELNQQLRRKYRDRWGVNAQALQGYAEALEIALR